MMYKLLAYSDAVLRLTDGLCIPAHEGNRHWQEYQAWLVAGNKPMPADPSPDPKEALRQYLIVVKSHLTSAESLKAEGVNIDPTPYRAEVDRLKILLGK